jgi:hypothetical protein
MPACRECGSASELAASIPARIGSPAYAIYVCAACGFVDWVALPPAS